MGGLSPLLRTPMPRSDTAARIAFEDFLSTTLPADQDEPITMTRSVSQILQLLAHRNSRGVYLDVGQVSQEFLAGRASRAFGWSLTVVVPPLANYPSLVVEVRIVLPGGHQRRP